MFEELQPTPLLSFAVRELNAFAGVVITASHNPAEYNGLKVYGEDGGQVTSEAAIAITADMESIDDIFSVAVEEETALLEKELLTYLDDEMSERYLGYLDGLLLNGDVNKNISIVYTPLHGAGGKLVLGGLEKAGYPFVNTGLKFPKNAGLRVNETTIFKNLTLSKQVYLI